MKGRGGVNDKGGVNGRRGGGVSLTGASEEDGTLCSSLASEKESGLFHHWNDDKDYSCGGSWRAE